MLTQEYLKEILDYNPETGIFIWKKRVSIRITIGKVAGTLTEDGYILIQINKRGYKAHQLAFLYMTGKFVEEVDHKNNIRIDNRWKNLREATRLQNGHNKSIQVNNIWGYKGISKYRYDPSKWTASITYKNKNIYLGIFKTKESAALEYNKAAITYYGDFAKLNIIKEI